MDDPFWVFGYGSLMWNPGFRHLFAVPATPLTGVIALAVRSETPTTLNEAEIIAFRVASYQLREFSAIRSIGHAAQLGR